MQPARSVTSVVGGIFSVDSDFKQQRLPAVGSSQVSPATIVFALFVSGIICLGVGGTLWQEGNTVHMQEISYMSQKACQRIDTNATCSVLITLQEDFPKPSFLYYQINNFYQNHRRYSRSRADKQLRNVFDGDVEDCKPADVRNGKILWPCGLIASSMFNDRFSLTMALPTANGNLNVNNFTQLPITKQGISWDSDRKVKFINPANLDTNSYTRLQIPGIPNPFDVADEDFIVWMRVAALPNFRKLYRKINVDLPKGTTLNVTVENRFDWNDKALSLWTLSKYGGRNRNLGISFIVIGLSSICMSVGFMIKLKSTPREVDDLTSIRHLNQMESSSPASTSSLMEKSSFRSRQNTSDSFYHRTDSMNSQTGEPRSSRGSLSMHIPVPSASTGAAVRYFHSSPADVHPTLVPLEASSSQSSSLQSEYDFPIPHDQYDQSSAPLHVGVSSSTYDDDR